jgi:DNA mismatch repair protein MutS
MTPMMQQYLEIKQQHPDTLLLFRLGDFYELFFEDAVTASKALDITLTGRDAGDAGRVPMCGVPYHSADQYIARLVDQGYRVAICEQVEDPKQAKGLVRREVVRVITPGTAPWEEGARNRFLAALVFRGSWGLALVDIGCGEVWWGEYSDTKVVLDRLVQAAPAELLLPDTADWPWLDEWCTASGVRRTPCPADWTGDSAGRAVLEQYRIANLAALGLDGCPAATAALGTALRYVRETQRVTPTHLRAPRRLEQDKALWLDAVALRHLELLEPAHGRQRDGTLLALLDRTRTAMGGRLLRRWIERPLADVDGITARLDAVEALVENLFVRSRIREALDGVYDLDRLSARLSLGTANPRDLVALARSLSQLPVISEAAASTTSDRLRSLADAMPALSDLARRVLDTLVDQPPTSPREGGLIREGADPVLDELREAALGGKRWLAELEQRERDRTGIRSLKVGYNKVFGYYIEVSKANLGLVPPEYERRQTLAGAERYVTAELKEYEARILGAQEQMAEREYELFCALRDACLDRLPEVQLAAEALAEIDVLSTLAEVAAARGYVRPVVRQEPGIHIVRGRHPVVEAARPDAFVPNDVDLSPDRHLILLTGPNMAGKSTYMRQVALIVVMAQMGSFVPAERAEIGCVDRIFTRIGASDDLAAGRSTFMVEMVELAQILHQATSRSLVLLDEIGRGTSTYDGLSIAEAVMEALTRPERRPLTLFATHYHELTEAAAALPGVVNCSVAVEERGDDIVFLHTVVPRPADRSYGIQVARLAGLPEDVIRRAQALLAEREQAANALKAGAMSGDPGASAPPGDMPSAVCESAAAAEPSEVPPRRNGTETPDLRREAAVSLPLHVAAAQSLLESLAQVDAMRMTPLQALERLHDLATAAREVLMWGKFE